MAGTKVLIFSHEGSRFRFGQQFQSINKVILGSAQQTKREFLAEWVHAVNSHGGFGVCDADVSRYPSDIHEILARHNSSTTIAQATTGISGGAAL